ncbi:MAG: RNA polymerase sigma factor [Alicyclobacillus sp.]|nr:RNA polymerase sigma factor [Alicyclobacillus sp.]
MVGRENVDDVIQEVYHRAHRYRKTLREERKIGPWLMHIARTQCQEWLRQTYRERGVVLPGDDMLEILADYCTRRSFTHMLDQVSLRMDLKRAMSRLPETYRVAIELHYLEELCVSEIAKLLALPVSTVKWRIHRGLELCRLHMLDYQFKNRLQEERKSQ